MIEKQPINSLTTDEQQAAVAAAYNGVAHCYDDAYRQKKSIAEDALILPRVKRLLRPKDRLIDLGCGTGFLLDHLSSVITSRFIRYIGVDISEQMVRKAKEKHRYKDFHTGDMGDLSACNRTLRGAGLFVPSTFDVAVSLFGSFSYPSDPHRVASEIYRVLRPGGRFLIMTLGRDYARRPSYILRNSGVSPNEYSSFDLKGIFRKFSNVRVQGMSRFVDDLSERLPQFAFNAYERIEAATIGKINPDSCYFLITTGEKH